MGDVKRLKEETNIGDVVENLGIEVMVRGTARFIPCFNHDERKHDNCYYKDGWKTARCMSCGATFNGLDMILKSTGCSFGDAVDRLWAINGYPEWFRESDELKPRKKSHPLTSKEAALLGIKLPSWAECPIRETSTREVLGEEIKSPLCKSSQAGHERINVKIRVLPEEFADDSKLKKRFAEKRLKKLKRIGNELKERGIDYHGSEFDQKINSVLALMN